MLDHQSYSSQNHPHRSISALGSTDSKPETRPAIEHPPIIRSLLRRFSPPFKPFGSKPPDTDDESLGSSDPHMTMSSSSSVGHAVAAQPQDLPDSSTQDFSSISNHNYRSSDQQSALSSHSRSHRHKERQKRANDQTPTNFRNRYDSFHEAGPAEENSKENQLSAHCAADSDFEAYEGGNAKRARRSGTRPTSQSRTRTATIANDSYNTRDSNRSSRSHGLHTGQPHRIVLQTSDSDSDDAISRTKNSSLGRSMKAGRAATARRTLQADPRTSVIISSDREDPSEPVASSSMAQDTSPRLRRGGRQYSPGVNTHEQHKPLIALSESENSEEEHPVLNRRKPRTGSEKTIRIKLSADPNASLKSSRQKRPKPPPGSDLKNFNEASHPAESPQTPNPASPSSDPTVKRRIAALMPATEPDESGQYESSTCHQCRVKTTRPKMICDQSQDPNCVVRVCHTCLMVRTVYENMPELRPPLFTFVPGGTMLCVKCRDICPCASCRRKRGEKEQCRRGLGSGLKGFYGMTPEEREQAFARKKEKQDAARQKKEAKGTEKKTPSAVLRREVSSIRGYDDDEHERLLHWAPLPVFPPLPKPRKKKRKRLGMIDGVRLNCKASDTDTDTTCSDSDTNDDSDSDSRSLSSSSTFRSTNPHGSGPPVLEPGPFTLPLSPNQRSTAPLVNNRWRSSSSRFRKDDPSSFSSHLLRAIKRKPKSNKAPVVWIKRGAVIQARKPPTTEFMKKLAEEQKGRPNHLSTADGAEGLPGAPNPLQNIPGQIANLAIDCEDLRRHTAEPHSAAPLVNMHNAQHLLSGPHSAPIRGTNEEFTLASSEFTEAQTTSAAETLHGTDNNHARPSGSKDLGQIVVQNLDSERRPSLAGNPSATPTGGNDGSSGLNELDPQSLNLCSTNDPESGMRIREGIGGESIYFDGMSIGSFPSLTAGISPSDQAPREGFESGSPTMDHQSYLAGLTTEQLSAVMKERDYAMAERGFLPPTMSAHSESSLKIYDQHHFNSTGISPELISAALPNGESNTGDSIPEVQPGDQGEKKDEGGEAEGADSLGVMLTDVPEDDQQMKKMIEAANWAAVWGATDGLGGFRLTDQMTGRDVRDAKDQVLSSPIWNDESGSGNGVGGSEKELFLRAMKSSVGDEWLTDVMPLDTC